MKITRFDTKIEASEMDIPAINEDISVINSKYKASYLCYQLLKDSGKEERLAIYLGIDGKILGYEIIAVGTDMMVVSTAKSLFTGAMKANATYIITAHNHIMNRTVKPSKQDIKAMNKTKKEGEILGVQLIGDFIVNSVGDFYTLHSSFVNDNDARSDTFGMKEKNIQEIKKLKLALFKNLIESFFYLSLIQIALILIIAALFDMFGLYNRFLLIGTIIVSSSLIFTMINFSKGLEKKIY